MSNDLRIPGLATGMDTQDIINKITKYSKAPVDRLKQQKQMLIWKQEAYRAQNTALTKLRDMVFDLKLQSTYQMKTASSSNNQVVTATAGANAPTGSYSVVVDKMASVAINKSTKPVSIRSSVTGNYADTVTVDASNNKFVLTMDGVNKTIVLPPSAYKTYKFNGTASDGDRLGDLADAIQAQLNTAGFAAPVYVKATSNHELVFYAGQKADAKPYTLVMKDFEAENGTVDGISVDNNKIILPASSSGVDNFYNGMTITIKNGTGIGQTKKIIAYDAASKTATLDSAWDTNPDLTSVYSITDSSLKNMGFINQATTKELVGNILTAPINVDSASKNLKITVDGVTKQISLDTKAGGYSLTELAAHLEAKIRAEGGNFDKIRVAVSNYNQLRITPTDSGDQPLAVKLESGSTFDVLWKLGFTSGVQSEYPKDSVNQASTLWNQKEKFMDGSFFQGKSQTSMFGFSINGQSFQFSLNNTLDEIISGINANATAGVSVNYDDFSDKLMFTSTKYGNNNENGYEMQINDPSGFFSQLLNVDQTKEDGGENAVVTINGLETQKNNNTFTFNGTTFTLTGTNTAINPVVVSVTANTTGISDKVEAFVNKYNEIIASMNDKLNETKATAGDNYTYYQPLTDDQKKSMTDDQVKTWEEKAKQGLLHNAPILSGLLRDMNTSLTSPVAAKRYLSGATLSGALNLNGTNRLQVTLGSQTREIVLEPKIYNNPNEYAFLVDDIQKKLNLTFGTNAIRASLSATNQLTFMTNNRNLTMTNATESNGLDLLGFSNGAKVTATYDLISQIGITTGNYQENGQLYFDKEVFENALTQDPDSVLRLLTNFEAVPVKSTDSPFVKSEKKLQEDSTKGIFYHLYDTISQSLTTISKEAGLTGNASALNNLGVEIISLDDRISTYEDRLAQEEDRLWKMFTNMETTINNLNSQSAWLSNVVGQMNGKG